MFFIKVLIFLMFMNNAATTIDIDRIARQAQEDANSWFKQFSTLYETETFKIWHSPYNNPDVNGLVQLTVTDAEEVLAISNDVIDFIKKQNLPFYWLINTHNRIDLTLQTLAENSFDEGVGYVMLHDLNDISKKNVPGLLIKSIDTSDVNAWLDVYNRSFGEYDPEFTQAYAQVMRNDIKNNDNKYYAAYIDNKLVGVGKVLVYPGYSYIHSIATDPAYRKQGIASQLVEFLLHIAHENESDYVLLEAGSAMKLYEKLGFKKIIQIHGFGYTPPSMKKRRPAGRPFSLLIR